MKNWHNLFVAICFAVIFFNVSKTIISNRQLYAEKFNIPYWSEVFEHSQYKVGTNEFKGNVDDPELFSLAGWRYLHGESPDSINFEHQPLTKYFFGITLLFFPNARVSQIILGILLLVILYQSGKELLAKRFLAIIPPLLLSFDHLFAEQLTKVQLDLMQVLWIQVFLIFFYQAYQYNRNLIKSMLALGLVALSKTFFVGILVFLAGIIFLILKKRLIIKKYILSSIFSVGVYFLGYLTFFRQQNIFDFLVIHIKTIKLIKSYVPEYHKLGIWRILFFGTWRKWFGDFGTMNVLTWSKLWPLATLMALGNVLVFKKIHAFALLQLLWIIVYLTTISRGLVFPRYLMAVLPSIYLLATYCGYTIIKKYANWH